MQQTAKLIITLGIVLLLVGTIVYFFGNKLHWIGNLPGDIRVERENVKFYFPITTMILVSVILNLLFKLWRYLQ
jgi:branched-subunit amino acid ABC-type transport system permease component